MPLYHVTTRARVPFILAEGLPTGTRGALRDVFHAVAPRETLLFQDRSLESLIEKAAARHDEEIVVIEVDVETRNREVHDPRDPWGRPARAAIRLGAYTASFPIPPDQVEEAEIEIVEGSEEISLDLRESDPHELAEYLVDVGRQVPVAERFGSRKVFVSDLHDFLEAADHEIGITQLKVLLLTLHKKGLLVLQRADLVPAMPREKVEASEIVLGSKRAPVATFHFLELPD